ncbi:MAG: tagaturonate reductase [Acutalibacteraceae bacterium]
MEKLCYQTLKKNNYKGYLLEKAPEKVLQFGEGNFLRAFVDYFVDLMNEKAGFNGKVVLVQPIASGLTNTINEQEGLYTLLLRGRENGKKTERRRIISAVSRCVNPYEDYALFLENAKNPELRFIVSNTTEAGIAFDYSCCLDDAPPSSFPGKLTAFLYERWKLGLKGFIILSCELIDHNGEQLKKCVNKYIELWGLSEDFKSWVERENIFCSTLVDRIVTGYPRQEAENLCETFGYEDNLIDTGEIFGFWVIEGPQYIKKEFPFEKAELPVIVVDDHSPYKQRKVRILNGAHTSMVLGAYLAGKDIVRECIEDDVICTFMKKVIYDEVIPTLDLPKDELLAFASAVEDRFNNPYVDHQLLSISLNSTSKWKARVMPSLTEYYVRKKQLPKCITFSFAAYLAFYHNAKEMRAGYLIGERGADRYEVRDEQKVLNFYYEHRNDSVKELVRAVIHNTDFWGDGLEKLDGFENAVSDMLERIETVGMYQAMKECL